VPEGDTVHRIALRIDAALGRRRLDSVAAPSRRSPLYSRAGELEGATLEAAEARGKHLLLRFDGGRVVHSHLGMSGRWFVRADGSEPFGRPWLTLAAGAAIAHRTSISAAAAARERGVRCLLGVRVIAGRPGWADTSKNTAKAA